MNGRICCDVTRGYGVELSSPQSLAVNEDCLRAYGNETYPRGFWDHPRNENEYGNAGPVSRDFSQIAEVMVVPTGFEPVFKP